MAELHTLGGGSDFYLGIFGGRILIACFLFADGWGQGFLLRIL
jgi:hypothetical protein